MGLECQQSRHCWAVCGGFLHAVGMSWRRRTQKLTKQLVVEVVCIAVWLVVFYIVAWSHGASSVFRGKKTKNGNDKTTSFLIGNGNLSIWSSEFQHFLIGPLDRISAPFTK
jgi:hypothetical protein